MIKIEHIDKYFNRFHKNQIHVIQDTSLELKENGLVALLGPSGSGKTTLLNVIGGLDKVRKGKIYVNGEKITRLFQRKIDKIRNLNIGYIFQDYKLIENMSVYDNVALVLKMIGIKDKKEIEKRVSYVLDRVGMLRYKKRPCNMLSGGERQRVGIARALVKNPNIIIADEPTGNLDSKNTIEIMNIIKAISKDKLVILVTHEANLAKFYASRIIELEDGKIVKDYKNKSSDELDYEMNNTLYLKDYKHHKKQDGIDLYSNDLKNIKVKLIVTDHNIYIKTEDERKIEVVDDESSIEVIDDHYKNISKEEIEKYEFDFAEIINNPKKLKYSSIFNPITFITNGFRKVFSYSVLKKILLIGFFLSGIFVLYSMSSIASSLKIDDKKFVTVNREYLTVTAKKVSYDDFISYENGLEAEYILPGNSIVTMFIEFQDFYQEINQQTSMSGSLASTSLINEKMLKQGRLPENEKEIVLDELVVENVLNRDVTKMIGILKENQFLERKVRIDRMGEFTIVGIVKSKSPSIYVKPSTFMNLLYHTKSGNEDSFMMASFREESPTYEVDDYHLYQDQVTLKEGRWPENDFETVIPLSLKENFKLNKESNRMISKRKLVVVGYYTTKENYDTYLVNSNMVKRKVISSSSDLSVYPKDKKKTLQLGLDKGLLIKDSYQVSKERYLQEQKQSRTSSIITAAIILGISLIEVLLMIRSSFLSRIKEVGIYRAIGVKKKDIYIMFIGEIIAITTVASIPGILLSAYIMNILSKISYLKDMIVINPVVLLLCAITVYAFNLVVGLIPVFMTIRKRPAQILARTDI